MTSELTGSDIIKSKLIDAPECSGVYRMFDVNKQGIYVGKAKNLKKRLTNYTKLDLDNKTLWMVYNTYFLEYSITNSEVKALLLEAQLTKNFSRNLMFFSKMINRFLSLNYVWIMISRNY